MNLLAMLLKQQDGAGNLAGRDLVANGVVKPLQGLGGKSSNSRRTGFGASLARPAGNQGSREQRRGKTAP
jgi:hypothetical protein